MVKRKLRIAISCTLHFSIPLKRGDNFIYAPIGLVDKLAKGLVERGHKVTLFASSDSKTVAKLISCNQISFAHHPCFKRHSDPMDYAIFYSYEQRLTANLYLRAQKKEFDIIHNFHAPFRTLPFTYFSPIPTLITLHDSAEDWRNKLLDIYKDTPTKFVSISNSQRKKYTKSVRYIATVHNGLKISRYSYNEKRGDYLLIAGRFRKEKGFHTAIKAAVAAKHKLVIAGLAKNKSEKEYFKEEIKPLVKKYSRYIKNHGLASRKEIVELNRKARAFLFPIQWEEPFGLVMIEAMACGTPVIAFKRGSVPEVIKHNKTGFIVPPLNKNKKPNIEGLVEAIKKIDQIDRRECRRHVEKNFTVEKMVDNYEKVYYKILDNLNK